MSSKTQDLRAAAAERAAADVPGSIARTSSKGRTPAKQSLHSGGLAVDIGNFDGFPESKKLAVRQAAERAGLSWGGTFKPEPDTIHFYFDPIPGQDRTELINNFDEQVRRLKSKR